MICWRIETMVGNNREVEIMDNSDSDGYYVRW